MRKAYYPNSCSLNHRTRRTLLLVFFVWFLSFNVFSQEPKLMLPIGHTDVINTAVFSPDGKKIVTASDDHSAKVWDAETGELVANLIGHRDKVLSAFFYNDGKNVITVSADYTVKIWDVSSGSMLRELRIEVLPKEAGKLNTESGVLSPDEKKIITFAEFNFPNGKQPTNQKPYGYSIKVWDVNSGMLLKTLSKSSDRITNKITFAPDSKKVIAICADSTAEVLNVVDGNVLVKFKGHNSFVVSAVYSPDGKKILTASLFDGVVKIWDEETSAMITTIKTGQKFYTSFAAFSFDGSKVITSSDDETVKIWNSKTGALINTLSGQNSSNLSVSLSADHKKIVTASLKGDVKIWGIETGKLLTSMKDSEAIFNTHSHRSQITNAFREVLIDGKKDIRCVEISMDGKKIVTAFGGTDGKIWDTNNGTLIKPLTGHTAVVNSAMFSKDGKRILAASSDKLARAWDASTGDMVFHLAGHTGNIISAVFSPDEKKILTSSFDHTAKVWSADSGKLLLNLDAHTAPVYSAIFSADGKKILTASSDNTAILWDAGNRTKLADWKGRHWIDSTTGFNSAIFSPSEKKILLVTSYNHLILLDWENNLLSGDLPQGWHDGYTSGIFSPGGKRIIATNNSNSLASIWRSDVNDYADGDWTDVWDEKNGSFLFSWRGHISNTKLACSANDLWTVTASSDGTAKVWDNESGRLLTTLTGHKGEVTDAVFSADSKHIVTTSVDGTAKVWQVFLDSLSDLAHPPGFPKKFKMVGSDKFMADTQTIIRDFANWRLSADLIGHNGEVQSAMFSSDSKKIMTTSKDNTNKIWDVASGKLLYTFFAVDSADYFTQIPGGYYKCTQNAAKRLHYVTKNLEVVTFDQLDIKYNRPDKVLEAIGCPDTALIHAYRNAYKRRIAKLRIDTNQFKDGYSIPKSDFKDRENIQPEQNQDKLSLHIYASDDSSLLERFNVWINQVPIYGTKGISLKEKKRKSFDTTVTVTLSEGENRIETSVIDLNGTESYHIPLSVKYSPVNPVGGILYFVGIGIDKFPDASKNLKFSVQDIRNMALEFREKYGDKCIIDTLFGNKVTVNNVTALKKKLLQSDVNDKVIIAYSGHGKLSSKDFDYFLSAFNFDFNNPAQNGLPYDSLENLLDGIPARKKLMLIDACNSGEVDKEEMKKQLTKANINLTQQNFELMQQLFVNINKGTGATIIAATSGLGEALELPKLGNGLLTHTILENMQKNIHVNLSQLKQYVYKRVPELSASFQTPTVRNENDVLDWQVW